MDFFAALIFFLFLPFLVSLLGRDRRWKGLAPALCLATMLSSPSSDLLANLFWFGAWVGAVLAILARFNLIKEQRSSDLDW
jgi:predicted membrane-bound mannosyltransferase